MPFGIGYGNAFGDGSLIPLSMPVSEVGGQPLTFDFTTDPDAPLPGAWEFFVLSDDGAGNKTSTAEPDGPDFFRVAAGLGWWRYERAPAIPAPSAPFDEHGLVASPVGIALGPNLELAVAFHHPPDLLDGLADEFQFEAIVGYRSSDDATQYFGARARAAWTSGGGWSPGVAFELVQASSKAPVVLVAATLPLANKPTDDWYGGASSELRVRFRDKTMTGILNGVDRLETAVPEIGGGKPIVMIRAWNRYGALLDPLACVTGVQLRTLRDLVHLGETPTIVGDSDLAAPPLPLTRLPIGDMTAKGLLKRTGARTWTFTQDVETNVFGQRNKYLAGTTVRMAGEPLMHYRGQELVSVVPDLGLLRGQKERA